MIRVERPEALAGVAELVLDRPGRRNALTPEMLDALTEAAAALDADASVRAVVLRGEGRCFCAGFDLALCASDADAVRRLLRGLSTAVRTLRRGRAIVVAAAHRAAIAGGCALLGGADIVVTDAGASLGYPVHRLGISPAVTGPALAGAIGVGPARALLLSGELISGARARAIGLAHRCVETPEDAVARAQLEARDAAAKPARGALATKAWMNELDGSLDERLFDGALHASIAALDGETVSRIAAAAPAARPGAEGA